MANRSSEAAINLAVIANTVELTVLSLRKASGVETDALSELHRGVLVERILQSLASELRKQIPTT